MRRRLSRSGEDNGSVLILIIGLVPVLLLMLAAGTDAAVLYTARRSLAAEADAAALAAAQGADLDAIYSGRAAGSLPLDCAKAKRIISTRFARHWNSLAAKARVTAIDCTGTDVSVTLASTATLPFASHFGINPAVTVKAAAAARSPFTQD